MVNIIDTSSYFWLLGKKTKGLRAKPLSALITDRSIISKFSIDTLEGKEPINSANMFCIGETGDAWQQTAKALLKKYNITNIDADGWLICEPKPENEVEFFEWKCEQGSPEEYTSYIKGLWGATVDGVDNLQSIFVGDFVCRQPHQHEDQWVVRKHLFINSYIEI